MDVLILGGGYGKRLFGAYDPDTYYPKGLVQISGRPCIEHILDAFSDGLISRVILETNREGEAHYRNWLKKSRLADKTEIFVEEVSSPDNCLGVLETIDIVSRHYQFKRPILIVSPDNIFIRKQDGLVTGYTEGARIAIYKLEYLEDAKKYGVVEVELDKIISCIEKPLRPQSRIIRTSCEIWDESVFHLLSRWNSSFNSDKVGDFINYLITNEINVESYETSGLWIDIGNEQDLEKAKMMVGLRA